MEVNFEVIDLLLVTPAIALFLASLIPLAIKVLRGNKEQNPFATISYGFIGIISATGFLVFGQGLQKTAFADALIFDGISFWTSLVVLIVTAFSLIYARESRSTNNSQFSEFVFLMLNAAMGMLLVVWSNDLIMLFIGIELMSLCLYILIALSSEGHLSKEASFKYFVLGSFASAIMLYGIAFIYGTGGSTYLPAITEVAADLISTNRLFMFGIIMLVVGLCFKVSIFPFHSWTPDVYQGSPTPVTGFMATGVKAVCLAFFLRIMATETLISERAGELVHALEWLAVLTIIVGNIGAIMQSNLKRMLAYSSVAHSGYAIIGIIAAGVGGASGALGASGLLFYIFAYSIMTIGAFGMVNLFEKDEESRVKISDLKGLASRSPIKALWITIFMLSLAGIPPTIGFFGKFFIFQAAVKQGFFWLVIWGVIGSVISVYYYLRPVVMMYMSEENGEPIYKGRQLSEAAVALSAILIIALGILANPFYEFVTQSVASVF